MLRKWSKREKLVKGGYEGRACKARDTWTGGVSMSVPCSVTFWSTLPHQGDEAPDASLSSFTLCNSTGVAIEEVTQRGSSNAKSAPSHSGFTNLRKTASLPWVTSNLLLLQVTERFKSYFNGILNSKHSYFIGFVEGLLTLNGSKISIFWHTL